MSGFQWRPKGLDAGRQCGTVEVRSLQGDVMSDIREPVAGHGPDALVGRWVLDRARAASTTFHTRHLFGLQAVHGTFQISRA